MIQLVDITISFSTDTVHTIHTILLYNSTTLDFDREIIT